MFADDTRRFWKGLGRAFAGGLIFAIPLLMTMEMWYLGFYLDRFKIGLLIMVVMPTLVGLSYFSGFEETFDIQEDTIDALVAFAVGAILSVSILTILGVLGPGMSLDAILGKVLLLTVPASIGAVVASKQLEQRNNSQEEVESATYGGELFIMAAGALLLAFNVAPTEEMILIAYKMTVWHALALAVITLAIMHAIVYKVAFRGEEQGPEGGGALQVFYYFTLVGYAIALLISAYVLWTFGRFEGGGMALNVMTTTVLAFAAGLGAAVSRLVL